ncbi:MAG: hypothetical protein Q9175_000906 [Cornicularia normoerica]
MAPFALITTLATILAFSMSVSAQSGTGTGLPIASTALGAPYPLSNTTLPYGPTGTGSGISLPTGYGSPPRLSSNVLGTSPSGLPGNPIQSGASCPVPTTVTTTTQVTVTVTIPASSAAAPTTPASVPYPIPGSIGSPMGTGTGYRTGTGAEYAMATGYAKRMEMRGLKQERKQGARFW